MSKDIHKMTNKELQAYCDLKGIDVDSKNVSKPTKQEFLSAIASFRVKQNEEKSFDEIVDAEGLDSDSLEELDDLDDFLNIDIEPQAVAETTKKSKRETRSEKRKKQWNELMPLRRVLITSNDNNQTTLKNQVHYCTWGNRLLGHHTDRFIVGKPWHVHEGALRNLQEMKLSQPVQDEEGNTIRFEQIPAYVIQRLPDLTLEERTNIAKRQTIRDSSIENVI